MTKKPANRFLLNEHVILQEALNQIIFFEFFATGKSVGDVGDYERPESRGVVELDKMTEFVNYDVVNKFRWQKCDFVMKT